jgi:hypothetical protein
MNTIIDNDGTKRWVTYNGILHRMDGPAVISDSKMEWWIGGQLHRDDGPAIEYNNGVKVWYIDGKIHRLDGPAVEYSDGHKEWYIDDKKIHCKDNDEFLRIAKMKTLL